MKVTKEWLEARIERENNWLKENSVHYFDYRNSEHKRNYYVNKLIEMEENELLIINI